MSICQCRIYYSHLACKICEFIQPQAELAVHKRKVQDAQQWLQAHMQCPTKQVHIVYKFLNWWKNCLMLSRNV